MQVLQVRNVHEALHHAVHFIMNGESSGLVTRSDSRNGPVLKSNWPVTTIFEKPDERVLFWPERDANPFFHFMEGLWMLEGRRDTAWIEQFNKTFQQFSDNGKHFHGAYGHRWREHFGVDQLRKVGQLLKKNPLDRRAVMAMWDPLHDLGHEGKDFPCNTTVMFNVNNGRLDMLVSCRSNDIVWGAYGANAVHMSMMQEMVAAEAGVPLGIYWQMSFNWHGYLDTLGKVESLQHVKKELNPYEIQVVNPYPMCADGNVNEWYQDLSVFIADGPIVGFRQPFFRRVATPLYQAWMAKENKDDPYRWDHAIEIVQQCQAEDWRIACLEWLDRRKQKWAGK